MNIDQYLKNYYVKYDITKQKIIANYIEKGVGNLLDIFDDIETRFDLRIYDYEWQTLNELQNREWQLRVFKLFSIMIEPNKLVENVYTSWVEEVQKEDPTFFAYLYVVSNFQYNVVKEIKRDEELSHSGRWYLQDYDKVKPYIEELFQKTNNESIKAQIQFCQYINEKDEQALKYLKDNAKQYLATILQAQSVYKHTDLIEDQAVLEAIKSTTPCNSKNKNALAMIFYYLWKSENVDEDLEIAGQTAFIIGHQTIFELARIIKNEQKTDFYFEEYKDIQGKIKPSTLLLKVIATNLLKTYTYYIYNIKDINYESLRFEKDALKDLIQVIYDFKDTSDILASLLLYAVLINQVEKDKRGKYIEDVDAKIKNLLLVLNKKGTNNEAIVKDIESNHYTHDMTAYRNYIKELEYKSTIDMASGILFGESKMATHYMLFNINNPNDSSIMTKFIYSRPDHVDKIQELLDKGLDEDYILDRFEQPYLLNGKVREAYFNYLDQDMNRYISRLNKADDEQIYEVLFNRYYIDMQGDNIEIALEGLKNKYKKIQYLSRDYLMGKSEYNHELEALHKQKLPKANKELIEYIMDYNKLHAMDLENVNLNQLVEGFYKPKKMDKMVAKLEIEKLPDVRLINDDKVASQQLLTYYLGSFLLSPTVELPLTAKLIKSRLHQEDLNQLGRYVYNQWYGLGAKANMKMAMVFAVFNCDEAFIIDFKKQLDEWTGNSRGAIASEGVKAMAFHGSDYALMQLDAISRKYKNKQVKKTAAEYFLIAAENMGLTKEQLADLVVPDLGFDANKELILDYGSRQFTARLNTDLSIIITNPDGKTIKNLPKPAKSDDEEIAKASKKQLSSIKKQLKTIVASQKLRLERAIFTERRWDMETFDKVFVKNPIMNMFAVNLIWGKYDSDNKLKQSFRYMDDGTFADADYDDISLEQEDKIGLVHPLDLSEEENEIWKENLSDNEIIQPINQIDIEVVELDKDKLKTNQYDEFFGMKVPAISLVSKLEKLGWYKCSITDGGGYCGLYIQFDELNQGAQIQVDYLYIGIGSEEVTVKDLVFFRKGKVTRGSYQYDEIYANQGMALKDVEPKFLNAVITQLREILGK